MVYDIGVKRGDIVVEVPEPFYLYGATASEGKGSYNGLTMEKAEIMDTVRANEKDLYGRLPFVLGHSTADKITLPNTADDFVQAMTKMYNTADERDAEQKKTERLP